MLFIGSVCVCLCVRVCVCVIEEHDSSKARELSGDATKFSDSTSRSFTVRAVNYVLILISEIRFKMVN